MKPFSEAVIAELEVDYWRIHNERAFKAIVDELVGACPCAISSQEEMYFAKALRGSLEFLSRETVMAWGCENDPSIPTFDAWIGVGRISYDRD